MKNWVPKKYSESEYFKAIISNKLLKLFLRLPNYNLNFIKNLKSEAEFYFDQSRIYPTKCPDDLNIKLSRIAFSDLFFDEEFDGLERGLLKLISDCKLRISITDPKRITEFFKNTRNRAFNLASNQYLYLNLGQINNIELCNMAYVKISHFSPSLISLSISIKPSEKFNSIFNSLIKTNAVADTFISRIDLKRGVIWGGWKTSVSKRQKEIDSLILTVNKEVVKIFRKYFKCGLSKYGPLPFVEVFTINESIDYFKEDDNTKEDNILKRDFLRSLGMNLDKRLSYKNDWISINFLDRERNYKLTSYQALLSIKDYYSVNKKNKDNDPDRLNYRFKYALLDLLTLLSMIHFFKYIEKKIIITKNIISPILRSQIRSKIKIGSLKKGLKKLTYINGLIYQQNLVKDGIKEKISKYFISNEIPKLLRDNNNLSDELFSYADKIYEYNNQFLSKLKENMNNLLAFKSTSINHTIQVMLILLAVLTLIIVFIPIEIRNKIFNFISSILK